MKVRAVKDFTHNGKRFREGWVFEVTNDLGTKLVRRGKCEDTDQPTDEEKGRVHSLQPNQPE